VEISTASLRLNRQVDNLLNMSRLESGYVQLKRDWCDVKELVNNVIAELDDQLKEHTVKIDIADDMPLFKLDYGLMEQVIYNLVSNAARYTKAGTLITITAGINNGFLVLAVEDNGSGFPEDEMDKVFQKFYRLKNSIPGGTGLGLSIVKGFTEAHNGTVSLENRATGGAIFTLNIPAEKWY
jgi:two-component system sensor histidine kinase KdpD